MIYQTPVKYEACFADAVLCGVNSHINFSRIRSHIVVWLYGYFQAALTISNSNLKFKIFIN